MSRIIATPPSGQSVMSRTSTPSRLPMKACPSSCARTDNVTIVNMARLPNKAGQLPSLRPVQMLTNAINQTSEG